MKLTRWQKIGLSVVLVLFATKVWLFDLAVDAEGEFTIDLAALHGAAIAGGAAGGPSGALPVAIEVEKIAEFGFPRSMVVAGAGLFTLHPMVLLSHRVVWP